MRPYNYDLSYEERQRRIEDYERRCVPESEATWAIRLGDCIYWSDHCNNDRPYYYKNGTTARYAARYFSDSTDRVAVVYRKVSHTRNGYRMTPIWQFAESFRIC